MTDKDDARGLLRDFLTITEPGVSGGMTEMATLNGRAEFYERIKKLRARITAHLAAPEREPVEPMSRYDAGLLNDFGGGNIEWWQDYIRAELGRAEEFYQQQFDSLRSALKVAQEKSDAEFHARVRLQSRINELEGEKFDWSNGEESQRERAEQAEKDRDICYISLQDMRRRLHEIASLVTDPRLDEKHTA